MHFLRGPTAAGICASQLPRVVHTVGRREDLRLQPSASGFLPCVVYLTVTQELVLHGLRYL